MYLKKKNELYFIEYRLRKVMAGSGLNFGNDKPFIWVIKLA